MSIRILGTQKTMADGSTSKFLITTLDTRVNNLAKDTVANQPQLPARQRRNWDFDWKFFFGDPRNAQALDYDDASWRSLDVPHDWSIEDHYHPDHESGWQGGYLPAGSGWYRKTFKFDAAWKSRLVSIMFDGVYMNSDVWINGQHLGHRPYGYIGFTYDLTPYLTEDRNVLAVRVDHSKPQSGRWYTGSGIYRHVWLTVINEVCIVPWGTAFTTSEVTQEQAAVRIIASIANSAAHECVGSVHATLRDADGSTVIELISKFTLPARQHGDFELTGVVRQPALWSPDNPYLYRLHTTVRLGDAVLDDRFENVGIRKIEFSPEQGFKLNGASMKMKGVCLHHDAGPVGAAVPEDVLRRRLRILKEMGCNAIRTAHNPYAPEFYEMCNELGFLVMNEFCDGWDRPKARDDYGNYFNEWWRKDACDFIRRDRNHPCVVLWSIGNEVPDPVPGRQQELVEFFHQFDPTRPVTQGGHDPTRGMTGSSERTELDLYGANGDGEERGMLERYHRIFPDVGVIGTELPHTYQTRGVYRTTTHWRRRDFPAPWERRSGNAGSLGDLADRLFPIPNLAEEEVFPEEVATTYFHQWQEQQIEVAHGFEPTLYYQSSYDNASVRSSARTAWQRTRDLPYMMGQFRWTGFDYLGETNYWPSRFANFGIIDICGFPKDHYYLYQSLWSDSPMVHILPHWTHPGKEGVEIPVVAYTNCDSVELFLNGKSLGKQAYHDEQLVWMVPYEAGTIKAVAGQAGIIVAEKVQATAGDPAAIRLTTDRKTLQANRTDVAHIAVDIVDQNDVSCPSANHLIEFEIKGPAKLLGVDNGDPLDLSPHNVLKRRVFRGKCLLLIQAAAREGAMRVTASSGHLQKSEIVITSNAYWGCSAIRP